jgi:hypothetical protein
MDRARLSHDILNILERLRIMHDLAKDGTFISVSRPELKEDLDLSLKELDAKFKELLQ